MVHWFLGLIRRFYLSLDHLSIETTKDLNAMNNVPVCPVQKRNLETPIEILYHVRHSLHKVSEQNVSNFSILTLHTILVPDLGSIIPCFDLENFL